MLVLVGKIVSRREFGVILQGTVVGAEGSDAETIRVKANVASMLGDPVVGETWEVQGTVRQTNWGPQADATSLVRVKPTGALICDFLAAHVPGIGTERARRLWAHFGTELNDVLASEDSVDAIARVIAPDRPVLAPRLAALLIRTWQNADGEAALVDWMSTRGFDDLSLVRRIYRLMGPDAALRLSRNPYCLVSLLPWTKVDAIGLKILAEAGAPKPHDDVRRLVGAVDAAVKLAIGRGDTALTQDVLEAGVAKALATKPQNHRVRAAIEAGERNVAVIRHGQSWRAPGAAVLEQGVTDRLRLMLAPEYPSTVDVPDDDLERWIVPRPGAPATHPEQTRAVAAALRNPVACLQGGAGVGKIFTTRLICDLWEIFGGNVLLCALAGKAALRLSRATGRMARSLARTLGDLAWREALMRRTLDEDLDGDEVLRVRAQTKGLVEINERTLVIVDEASMVDLPTMHTLLRHLPKGARLLMVGDEAQLPPIGFGLVYHRLVKDPIITSCLTTVHRQAAETGIPDGAAAVRGGRMPRLAAFDGPAKGIFLRECEADELAEAVESVHRELGGSHGGVLIVTATNRGQAGVDELNALMQRNHVDETGCRVVRGHLGRWFGVGEPVIHLRNDYAKGLFNGLIGRVTAVDEEARSCTVLFDGDAETHTFGTDQLLDLALAYAITCHKAQGSSAPRVVIPLYHSPVLDPSWVYTAMTRSEEQVIFVGDPAVMEAAIGRPWPAERRHVAFEWPAHTPLAPV